MLASRLPIWAEWVCICKTSGNLEDHRLAYDHSLRRSRVDHSWPKRTLIRTPARRKNSRCSQVSTHTGGGCVFQALWPEHHPAVPGPHTIGGSERFLRPAPFDIAIHIGKPKFRNLLGWVVDCNGFCPGPAIDSCHAKEPITNKTNGGDPTGGHEVCQARLKSNGSLRKLRGESSTPTDVRDEKPNQAPALVACASAWDGQSLKDLTNIVGERLRPKASVRTRWLDGDCRNINTARFTARGTM